MSGRLKVYTMRKVTDNYTAEIIITIVVLVMLLTSCSSEPPRHELYYELSVHEKEVYNSLSAKERKNINKNKYIYQLRNALGDASYEMNTNSK